MVTFLDPSVSSRKTSTWSIQEMVTFLDPGFHETKQEEFDGDIKDRKKISKNWYSTMWVGKITR